MITRCGYGFDGCVPPTDDERMQTYMRGLSCKRIRDLQSGELVALKHRPHAFAVRCADGLSALPKLRALWRLVDRLKRKTKPRKAAPKKPTTVVPFRRRA